MDTPSMSNPPITTPDPGFQPRFTGRLILGLTVILVGVLFLLDALDVPGIGDVWRQVSRMWPAIFIIIGLAKLINARNNSDRLKSAIYLFLGAGLLANSLDLISISLWRLFWPTIIIIFGVHMMTRGPRVRMSGRYRRGSGFPDPASAPADTGAHTSAFAMMSSASRRVFTPDFKSGDATAFMGGCEIDLRPSGILTGPAIFDVFALMGGIDLYVPGDWVIQNEGVAILGAIEDNRKEIAGNPSKVLIIRGFSIMGGVEIKN